MQKKVHLLPHPELRGLAAKAQDVELWCWLALLRTRVWNHMALSDRLDHTESFLLPGLELVIVHLEQSERIIEAELASRRILASLPKE